MVLLQPCIYFLLESNALRCTTSSQTGVISALVPLQVAACAWLMLGEPLGRATFAGLFLSVAIGWLEMGESLNGLQSAAAAAVIVGVGLSQKKARSS